MTQHERIRIEVVIEEIGLATLTERLTEAGAVGWSVLPITAGSGRHGTRQSDHVAGISGNVLLLVLAHPDEAPRLIAAASDVVTRFWGLVMSAPVTVHST